MQFCFNCENSHNIIKCLKMFSNNLLNDRELVFLCIGTDKVIGDSFGPIVGHFLSEIYSNVYGTLKETVNATNLIQTINIIKKEHKDPYIVTLDSALGKDEIVNNIVIGKGGIVPGSALNKKFESIGDMYINAIVAKNSEDNFKELKSVKMYDVLNLSSIVFNAISNSLCLKKTIYVNNHIS